MNEKPLHVRVAEALGCEPYAPVNGDPPHDDYWICPCAPGPDSYDSVALHGDDEPELEGIDKHWDSGYWVRRYDKDWAATGPLLEKYAIWTGHGNLAGTAFFWARSYDGGATIECDSQVSLLHAVCNLILALKEAGKL